MSVLTPTSLVATVTFLGLNIDGKDLSTNAVKSVDVSYAGFVGDSQSGLTRSSCVRVVKQYPKGTDIRNVRQISALSIEELNQISKTMRNLIYRHVTSKFITTRSQSLRCYSLNTIGSRAKQKQKLSWNP